MQCSSELIFDITPITVELSLKFTACALAPGV